MNTKKLLRWGGMVLLLVHVLTAFHFGFAQDDDSSGVGGAADAADNLNVSAVPSQEQAQSAVNTPPSSDTQSYFDNAGGGGAVVNNEYARGTRKARHAPVKQAGEVIYENRNDKGEVLKIYADFSLVYSDAEGEYFQGYLTVDTAERLMIVGTHIDGTQFAIYVDSGYRIGLTPDGDVLMGTGDFWYIYDYDEDGNFLGMSDSDGNEYDVEFDEDGSIYIIDADGNEGDFYADGSYELYDEDGNFLDEGALFGEDDGDELDAESDDDSDDSSSDDSIDDDSSSDSDDTGDDDDSSLDDSGDAGDDSGDDGSSDDSGSSDDGGSDDGGDSGDDAG
jgi:hypothetical protein